MESNDREARNVIRASLILVIGNALVLTVDVGDAGIWIMASESVWHIHEGMLYQKSRHFGNISQVSALSAKRGILNPELRTPASSLEGFAQ